MYHVCWAISGYFVALAWNCLTSTLDYIIMQINTVNHEKGYWSWLGLLFRFTSLRKISSSIICVSYHYLYRFFPQLHHLHMELKCFRASIHKIRVTTFDLGDNFSFWQIFATPPHSPVPPLNNNNKLPNKNFKMIILLYQGCNYVLGPLQPWSLHL